MLTLTRRRNRTSEPKPRRIGLDALGQGIASQMMIAVMAQATAMGVPTHRLDELWQRVQSEKIPDTPSDLVGIVERAAADIGVELHRI